MVSGRVVSLALALGLIAPVARADKATVAEALFREGKRLMKDGNFAEACPKLEESQRIDPAIGTLIRRLRRRRGSNEPSGSPIRR